jgi:hypothetical protein
LSVFLCVSVPPVSSLLLMAAAAAAFGPCLPFDNSRVDSIHGSCREVSRRLSEDVGFAPVVVAFVALALVLTFLS